MSATSTLVNQNIEIIQVICLQATTFDGILAALQSRFASTGWTETLLSTRISAGLRQGLFIPVGDDPTLGVLGYQVNPRLASLNYAQNAVYVPYCSQIRSANCAPSCSILCGTPGDM